MPQHFDINALKRTVSSQVLAVPGVSGIGVGDDVLRIYLEKDAPTVREQVEHIVRAQADQVRIDFRLTGKFTAFPAES